MRTAMGPLGILTIASTFSFVTAACAVDTPQRTASQEETSKPGLQSETPQEQLEKQQRLDRQNLQEQQRLQNPSLMDKGETPPYKETPQLGGQKQAGPSDFPQPSFPFMKGEFIKVEGDMYTLRDAEGKEVQVRVDKNTKMARTFNVGDWIEVQRTLQGYALAMNEATAPKAAGLPPGSGPELGGAKQAVRGEVLKIDGDKFVIKDRDGHEVAMIINQNTRMFCGPEGSMSSLLPAPSASDMPQAKGQPQDLARTNEQKGSEVGPGTKSEGTAAAPECKFKVGDKIEAEISDMGAATFIKQAGRPQPGGRIP